MTAKRAELYSSLRHRDSDVKWAASRVLLTLFLKGEAVPPSALGMAFNIVNGRAFDPDEDQKVRNISQDLLEKAISAGIEEKVTIGQVMKDLKAREPMVRILAVESLIIACEYDNDISKAIPALEKALEDKDLGVRRNAAFAFLILSEHGYDLSESRKSLEEAAKHDPDEKVKRSLKGAIENLQKEKELEKDYL